jgi:membrane-associated phospholipid phosphatase
MGSRMSKGPTAPASVIGASRGAPQALARGASLGMAAGPAIFTAAALLATLRHQSWDFALTKAINSFAGHSPLLDRVEQVLTVSQLPQGVALVAVLWYLWFETNDVDTRARLLSGIVAAACAGVLSRVFQLVLPTHPRPLHTEALGFVMPAGVQPATLNHFNPFPSDHGAVFFGLAIVVWSNRPGLGLAAFAWAAIVDFARVYEGYHYPSDIMGSIGLGLLAVSLFHNPSVHRVACRVVAVEQTHRSWFYPMAFLLTYQVATLFDDVRLIGRGLFSAVLQHDPFGGS